MSATNELVARLITAGAPADLIADVAMALARGEQAQATLDGLRAANAERQARSRVKRGITPRNVTQRDERYARGEKEKPPHPHKKNTPLISPNGENPPTRATRLPDDFVIPVEWLDWAIERRGWQREAAVEEGECFCRYWQAKGSGATKRSWKKTWENWVIASRREGGGNVIRNEHWQAISRKYAGRA